MRLDGGDVNVIWKSVGSVDLAEKYIESKISRPIFELPSHGAVDVIAELVSAVDEQLLA